MRLILKTATMMALAGCINPIYAKDIEVISPSGNIYLALHVADSDGRISYEIGQAGNPVIGESSLGLILNTGILDSITGEPEITYYSKEETYRMPHGKHEEYHNTYNEIKVSGRRRGLSVRFRIFDDGVAYRYELENRSGNQVLSDISEFNFTGFELSWAQRYHNDYSWYYEKRDWSSMRETATYNVPVLVRNIRGTYILLTESASTSSMSAGRVQAGNMEGQLKLVHPSASIIQEKDFATPWRTMIIGSLPDIVKSTLITNLNEPGELSDVSWIKPGRVAWNWGAEDGDSTPTPDQVKRYIDFASAMGWEYFLLDDGWDGRIDLDETVAYADDKNVGLIIWSHQNRFLNDYNHINEVFHNWANIGIKGLKIDFFEDDSQEMLRKYEYMLKAAASNKLMLNFHGCTKPSGMERTWPNMMTSEAVLGGEFYMFNTTMTPGHHTVNLCLSRNVLGGMDYTPVKFGNRYGRMITDTTWSYQLALATAFESALQSICDTPENILGSIAEPLLRNLPVRWEETRCIEAEPDSYITIARRSGEDWWISSISAEAREIVIPTDFACESEEWNAHIYTEGSHRSDIAFEKRRVRRGERISLNIGHNSGATVVLTENDNFLRPQTLKFEAEKYNRLCQRIDDDRCSGGAWLDGIGGFRKMIKITDVEAPETGEYNMTLFFISKGERDAYLQVNDGEKIYHHFSDTGGNLYFTTVTVKLNKGINEITIGNESGVAPGFDRFVLTRITNDETGNSDIESVTEDIMFTIGVEGETLKVQTLTPATLTVYSIEGRILFRKKVGAGDSELPFEDKGSYIVNLASGCRSVSRKIMK